MRSINYFTLQDQVPSLETLMRDQFWIREVIDGHEEEQAQKFIDEFGEQKCPFCGQDMDPVYDSEHKLHGFECPDYCFGEGSDQR